MSFISKTSFVPDRDSFSPVRHRGGWGDDCDDRPGGDQILPKRHQKQKPQGRILQSLSQNRGLNSVCFFSLTFFNLFSENMLQYILCLIFCQGNLRVTRAGDQSHDKSFLKFSSEKKGVCLTRYAVDPKWIYLLKVFISLLQITKCF